VAFNLQNIIFTTKFWTKVDVVKDPNKDGNGKGTLQRYHEAIAEDYDVEISPLIDNMVANNIDPDTVLSKFIIYLESLLLPVNLGNDESMRRRVLKYTTHFNRIKGTRSGYEIMFSMLGFSTTLVEVWDTYTWDSATKDLDDDPRIFDSNCRGCSPYTILLDTLDPLVVTPELLIIINNVIDYNEPINAELTDIIINGVSFASEIISIEVLTNGDLTYNNQDSPGTILTLNQNGCIFVNGDHKTRYTINSNGDLIYT
jgi:hypothetical protein